MISKFTQNKLNYVMASFHELQIFTRSNPVPAIHMCLFGAKDNIYSRYITGIFLTK